MWNPAKIHVDGAFWPPKGASGPQIHRHLAVHFALEEVETSDGGFFVIGKWHEISVGVLTIFLELVPNVGIGCTFILCNCWSTGKGTQDP